ncbi:zinc finger protein ZPR1-like [Styela clava]
MASEPKKTKTNKPLFQSDHDELETTEIQSLCMYCHQQGTTRLLLTKIPFFKDLVVSSFSCDHCGHSDTDLQSADPIQEFGVKMSFNVDPQRDLNRRVVKTESTTIKIPEIDFEIPPESQKGILTTIEGVMDRAVRGLEQEQPVRRIMDPATAEKIDAFVKKLKELQTREKPFKMILEDPAGNCHIENYNAPNPDPQMIISHFERTKQQNEALGISAAPADGNNGSEETDNPAPGEVMQFKTNCPNCNAPVDTNMKMVDIPHFKEIILMATSCDTCGERTNEVKSGTGFEEKGKKITLNVTDASDMNRDLLKSETCSVRIPEIDMEIGGHAIAGKFTTLEGLLDDIRDLVVKKNPFTAGDSVDADMRKNITTFGEKLESLKNGKSNFTFIMDDPAGNSYLQNVYAPEDDPEMKIELYERTYDQNEELGLNDMKTENYEQEG